MSCACPSLAATRSRRRRSSHWASTSDDWPVRLALGTGPAGFADSPDVRALGGGVLCVGTTSQDPIDRADFVAYLAPDTAPQLWRTDGAWHVAASDPTGALLAAVTESGLQLGWLPIS